MDLEILHQNAGFVADLDFRVPHESVAARVQCHQTVQIDARVARVGGAITLVAYHLHGILVVRIARAFEFAILGIVRIAAIVARIPEHQHIDLAVLTASRPHDRKKIIATWSILGQLGYHTLGPHFIERWRRIVQRVRTETLVCRDNQRRIRLRAEKNDGSVGVGNHTEVPAKDQQEFGVTQRVTT